MRVGSVRLTLAGVRYLLRPYPSGARTAWDAATLSAARALLRRPELKAQLWHFTSAQLRRPVAPQQLEAVLLQMLQRGTVLLEREREGTGVAQALALGPVKASVPQRPRSLPPATALIIVDEFGRSLQGHDVTISGREGVQRVKTLQVGPIWVAQDERPTEWQLELRALVHPRAL